MRLYKNASIFNADGAMQTGFIADQVGTALWCGCTGNKDAVDANGILVLQSIDIIAVVSATLVKAVQELSAAVALLTARVTTLEIPIHSVH
jgi:hypothetical protein